MTSQNNSYVALLRGINVGGHNKIPMSELRALCSEIGWDGVQSYIQSGNLIFSAAATPTALENALEESIEQRFGLQIPVIVRSTKEWRACANGNPFPDASRLEPNLVMLALSKATPEANAIDQLRERADDGERLARVGNTLWIHFGEGAARSKLSTALLDRIVGSPVTSRNWRTVQKLVELAGPPTNSKQV